jgi:hypothetical protein
MSGLNIVFGSLHHACFVPSPRVSRAPRYGIMCFGCNHQSFTHSVGFEVRHRAGECKFMVVCERILMVTQMFEWNWDSLASECQNFLGPAGFVRFGTDDSFAHDLVVTGTSKLVLPRKV